MFVSIAFKSELKSIYTALEVALYILNLNLASLSIMVSFVSPSFG